VILVDRVRKLLEYCIQTQLQELAVVPQKNVVNMDCMSIREVSH
jgi:hypothetical protein